MQKTATIQQIVFRGEIYYFITLETQVIYAVKEEKYGPFESLNQAIEWIKLFMDNKERKP